VNRAISEDLETIVMKCLEREPNRRYDSARALAEDLQRYLDGEPVRARRASVGYWLLKKLRKHRVAAVLSAVLLAASVVVATLWIRSARRAEEQAKLSQELGADLKEMELYMRYAYGLPLHDIERERDIVRGRLRAIEERMARMGRAAEGPGNYALGRGYLSLREPEAALRHLRASAASGYASPELELALGQALGELYKEALDDTRRIQDPERKRARVRELEVDLRDPALLHLRAAVGSRPGAPAYVEGLIAFYEGKYEQARAKAREALVQSPWLHEAEVLVGDTHYAEGAPFKHDGDFNYETLMAHWKPAEEAYTRASTIARSDPLVLEAQCDLWTQTMFADTRLIPITQSFEKAKSACEMAITASSRRSAARATWANANVLYAGIVPRSPEERSLAADKARDLAEAAVKAGPNDAMAQYMLGMAWYMKWNIAFNSEWDFALPVENAIRALSRALELDPEFLWATRELGHMYQMKGLGDFVRGKDAAPAIEKALDQFERAAALAPPSYTMHQISKCQALAQLADVLVARGQSSNEALERAITTCDAIKKPRDRSNLLLPAFLSKARYELGTGTDPSASIELALKAAEASLAEPQALENQLFILKNLSIAHTLAARRAIERGDDPEPALQKARETCRRIANLPSPKVNPTALCADVELAAIQWAMKRGKAQEAHFNAALAILEPIPDEDPWVYTLPSQKMAEILERRAAFRLGRGESPDKDIERGLVMVERTLARNPHHAEAIAARAGLYLVRAQSTRDRIAQKEAARIAQASFTEAFQNNPLLEREHGPAAREAERLQSEDRTQKQE
jgi:serine/threonine-protein kinase